MRTEYDCTIVAAEDASGSRMRAASRGRRVAQMRHVLVEHLGSEVLVYDEREHRAYVLPASRLTTRRAALRHLVALGIAVAIVAPTIARGRVVPRRAADVSARGPREKCVLPSGACGRCLGKECL